MIPSAVPIALHRVSSLSTGIQKRGFTACTVLPQATSLDDRILIPKKPSLGIRAPYIIKSIWFKHGRICLEALWG
jgi:hypothetical protein